MLDHVLEACRDTGLRTVLLVPHQDFEYFRDNFNAEVFPGDESDVLSRFLQCAELLNIRHVVRITSDCPMISSSHILSVVDEHIAASANCDESVLTVNTSYELGSYRSLTLVPDGFDVEVFDLPLLQRASTAAVGSQREHVTTWMREHARVHITKLALALMGKFSVDTEEDLDRLGHLLDVLKTARTVRVDR